MHAGKQVVCWWSTTSNVLSSLRLDLFLADCEIGLWQDQKALGGVFEGSWRMAGPLCDWALSGGLCKQEPGRSRRKNGFCIYMDPIWRSIDIGAQYRPNKHNSLLFCLPTEQLFSQLVMVLNWIAFFGQIRALHCYVLSFLPAIIFEDIFFVLWCFCTSDNTILLTNRIKKTHPLFVSWGGERFNGNCPQPVPHSKESEQFSQSIQMWFISACLFHFVASAAWACFLFIFSSLCFSYFDEDTRDFYIFPSWEWATSTACCPGGKKRQINKSNKLHGKDYAQGKSTI